MLPKDRETKILAAIKEFRATVAPLKKGIAKKYGIPESTFRGRLKLEGLLYTKGVGAAVTVTAKPVPVVKMEEPELEAPELEPEAAESETEAPESEPEAPESEPEAPESEPEAPESEPEAPESELEAPESESEAHKAEPEGPESEAEAPESESEAHKAEPEVPEPQRLAEVAHSEGSDNNHEAHPATALNPSTKEMTVSTTNSDDLPVKLPPASPVASSVALVRLAPEVLEREKRILAAITEYSQNHDLLNKALAIKYGIPESTFRGRLKSQGIVKPGPPPLRLVSIEKEAQIQAAIEEFLSSGVVLKKAMAKKYGIPESTLRGRLNGRTLRLAMSKSVPRPLDKMEVAVTHRIEQLVAAGVRPERPLVEDLAQTILGEQYDELVAQSAPVPKSREAYAAVGSKWFYGYLKRHPQFSYRKVQVVDLKQSSDEPGDLDLEKELMELNGYKEGPETEA